MTTNWGSYNNRNLFLHLSGAQKFEIRLWRRVPPSSSSFWCPRNVFVWTAYSSLGLIFTHPSSLSLLFWWCHSCWIRARPNDPTLNTPVKTLFPNKAWRGMWEDLLWGHGQSTQAMITIIIKKPNCSLCNILQATCLVSLKHQCYEKLQVTV